MIQTIRDLRRTTSTTLVSAFEQLSSPTPSEAEIRDEWHRQLASVSGLADEGWYLPPPKGVIVAVGDAPTFDRVEQPTFRAEHTWSSRDVHLGDESLLCVYASPVQIDSGLIGDLGCTLYRGQDRRLMAHLRDVWRVTQEIAQLVTVGMTLGEVYRNADKLIADGGFRNNIYSVSDRDRVNIGHTIPWSEESMSDEERLVLRSGTPEQRAHLVSGKRRFVSETEQFEITDNFAFTVEPRLCGDGLPTGYFHTVVAFENGKKAVVTEFDPIFEYFDMDGFDI